MFEAFTTAEAWIAVFTLTLLEIVLGVDNIIFISIVTGKLPKEQQKRTRNIGLVLAMFMRLLMLLAIGYILKLDKPLFYLPFHLGAAEAGEAAAGPLGISVKDLLLFLGGLFLVGKSVSEIHGKMEGEEHSASVGGKAAINAVILQIILIDMVFSFDSILTAVGLTKVVPIMMVAVIISVFVMMAFSGAISAFINRHPTFQILALSFLILIGFTLIVESLHVEVAKGYVYFSVAFALLVEVVNLRIRKKVDPVQLHERLED